MDSRFQKIKEAVEKELSCSAHDMDHVMRVYNLSLQLAENEGADLEVLKASALLHDIARVKEDNDPFGKIDHAILSSEMAAPILKELEFSEDKIKHIQKCIVSHRYRTGNEPQTKEAQILFDADKLDSLGAIGIARSFVWVGRNNAKIYTDTNIQKYIEENLDGKISGRIQDKTKHSPQIEFETKLKFLINKLYTEKAKQVCKERLKFYKFFLDRLKEEIDGKLHKMQNIEIEIRSFISKEKYEELLEFFNQNAEFVKVEEDETEYYAENGAVRIRQSQDSAKMVLKTGDIHDEFREEYEIPIQKKDFHLYQKMFEKLNIPKHIQWKRKKHTFDWKGVTVELGDNKGYGYIIELEELGTEENKHEILEELKQKLNELNIPLTPKEIFKEKYDYYKNNWRELIK